MLFFIDFWSRLLQTNMIIGMCVAILGLATILLAKKIVKSHKKVDEVAKDDKAVLAIQGIGLLLILVAMFIMILY